MTTVTQTLRASSPVTHGLQGALRSIAARATRSFAVFVVANVLAVAGIYILIDFVFRLELQRAGLLNVPVVLTMPSPTVHPVSLAMAAFFWVAMAIVSRGVIRKLSVALEDVRRVHQAQNEFLSIVSHEFRTPLTGIQGFSEIIRDEALTPELVHEYAADINTDARRLSRMIGDMLDVQRLERGKLRIDLTPVDLNQVVRDVARQQSISSKKHEIVLSFDRPVLIVDGDADRLTQIVTNLVSNAVKYATPGKITVSTALDQGEVSLEVSDEGPGIPPESVERIFERYYRVPTKDVGLITGTGLGLPIVRGLVELHRGRVWCSSSPIAGTTFHVVLPAPTAQPVS
jgi:signal transduction histidine kinase